jgi:hypothetical protein
VQSLFGASPVLGTQCRGKKVPGTLVGWLKTHLTGSSDYARLQANLMKEMRMLCRFFPAYGSTSNPLTCVKG